MSKKKKSVKRKKKIDLPKDRNGVPINVGDWLMFDEGPMHVVSLTYDGYGWAGGNEEDVYFSDNLSGGTVITAWR